MQPSIHFAAIGLNHDHIYGQTTILGTDGYIEVRKNIDITRQEKGSHLYLVDHKGVQCIDCSGVAPPYGHQLIQDLLHRTETAMTQEHCFLASELALKAQAQAARWGYLEATQRGFVD